MELPLSAFTPGFSTLRLQFIDRSFDYRFVRKKGFNNLPDLGGESRKGLPELAEFFLIPGCLDAHSYISKEILPKKARKNDSSRKKLVGMSKRVFTGKQWRTATDLRLDAFCARGKLRYCLNSRGSTRETLRDDQGRYQGNGRLLFVHLDGHGADPFARQRAL